MHRILSGKGLLLTLALALVLAYPVAKLFAEAPATYTAEQVKRGEYLITVSGCHDCHSPKVYDASGMPANDPNRLMSGHPAGETVPAVPDGVINPAGWVALTNSHFTAWAGPWGVSYAMNLTPDTATGIGGWTEEMFMNAVRTGKHLGMGRPILPPMPWPNLVNAKEEDLRAMFAYLRSLPAISNRVPDPIPPKTN